MSDKARIIELQKSNRIAKEAIGLRHHALIRCYLDRHLFYGGRFWLARNVTVTCGLSLGVLALNTDNAKAAPNTAPDGGTVGKLSPT